MNWGRIIGGGLLAGLVMNISEFVLHAVVLRADGEAIVKDLNQRGYHLPTEGDPNALMLLLGITFVLGILAVWTYAAARPRFGPGPGTAICVGLAVWAMSYLYSAVYVYAGFPIFPAKIILLPAVWTFVEMPVATLIGAWLYKE